MRSYRELQTVRSLAVGLLVSLLAGVLLAGLAAPLLGGLGLVARASATAFDALPSQLAVSDVASRSTVLAGDGSVLATFYRVDRVDEPFAAIPATMRQAIVDIEDSRFYEHGGVDVHGTLRAAATDLLHGGAAQGGSTLTQQYVKNALLDAATDKAAQQAAVSDSIGRKVREARYAVALEQQLPKDEILRRYLNIVYFGNGAYGIGAAAERYFGIPVQQLTLGQSAELAGVVQNPSRYDVASTDPAVQADLRARRDTVLDRMRDLGSISPVQHDAAVVAPLAALTPVRVGAGCQSAATAPFFCAYVQHELTDTPVGAALGATAQARLERLLTGGLTIRTSLDPAVQASAQRAVDTAVPATDPSGVAAASDVVEPGTGAIRAMAVDRPFGSGPGATSVDLADGGTYGYQPGSTFKTFFLASALMQGIPLDLTLYAPNEYTPTAFPYLGADGTPQPVGNAGDSEAGTYDMVTATHASVNTYYLQLAERTGLDKPLALAEAMGVRQLDHGRLGPLARVGSAVLGTAGVSPLAMAGAYATFAARGTFCPPQAVQSITDASGGALAVPAPACHRVMDATVADTVTSVLNGVVDGNDPLRTGAGAALGARPVAGKTGTTDGSRAASFVGYTPQLADAVWVGRPTPSPLTGVTIAGRHYTQVFGGDIPASIFRATMSGALAAAPVLPFAVPGPLPGAVLTAPTTAQPAAPALPGGGTATVVGPPAAGGGAGATVGGGKGKRAGKGRRPPRKH